VLGQGISQLSATDTTQAYTVEQTLDFPNVERKILRLQLPTIPLARMCSHIQAVGSIQAPRWLGK